MSDAAIFYAEKLLRNWASAFALACLCLASDFCRAATPFVYETPYEFLSSGDFNGDGIPDVLVLDKLTGNARVGYGGAAGVLTWSAPMVTGISDPSGCAVGSFLVSGLDAVAVTSPTANDVNLVDLSGTNVAGTPKIVTPSGLGLHTVVALSNPLGGSPPPYNSLLVASSNNNNSAELLDLMTINAGIGAETGEYAETGSFDRGNELQVSVTPATFATGIVRGSNDTFDVWQFTNSPGVMVSYTNLLPGSDYAFGIFNGETYPRFLFYQPGGSNVTIVPLREVSGNFVFEPQQVVSFSTPVEEVFYENLGTNGGAIILLTNGIQTLTLPGGSPVLGSVYASGAGGTGDVFTGVVPLGNGLLTLLDAPPGGSSSVHGQVLQVNGSGFTQVSSSNLPPLTARNTRANVWLFQTEPFVNRQPGLIASYNTPDWSDGVTGLPGALTVTVQDDGGTSSGLQPVTTSSLGAPPAGSTFGLVNQYNPAISVFSYSSPQPVQPVSVLISPTPGIYDGPIQISFSTLKATDKVYYRIGAGGSWQLYSATFPLTNDNTIEYYGTNAANPARSQLLSAAYSLGNNTQPTPTVNLGSGTSTTNPPPAYISPGNTVLSSVGTIFYGRRSVANTGTIWSINYDGSGDSYITTGIRPRASRDGNWLVFMRGPKAFNGEGNIWMRNLQTGQEQLLFENTSRITCYDWSLDNSAVIMDYDCGLWILDTNGSVSELVATDCYQQAPVRNPINGRLAYQDVDPMNALVDGIYVAGPIGNGAKPIVTTVLGASWPEWSPDGQKLSFADDNSYFSLDTGTNLWVVSPDGSLLSRICDFTGTTNHFEHGAIWSPDSTSLVGAGTIFGTNGLWIIPLNYDRTDCLGEPTLLPTTPGDSIDFAGSIVVAPPLATPPRIVVQTGTNAFTIAWNTNFPSYTLEYTLDLTPPILWVPIPGPFPVTGVNYIYQEPINTLLTEKIFRLNPGAP